MPSPHPTHYRAIEIETTVRSDETFEDFFDKIPHSVTCHETLNA